MRCRCCVVILLGCFDAARFVLINQKMSRVASQSADLVAQLDVVTEAEIDDLFVAADSTAEPFPLGTEGKVVVSLDLPALHAGGRGALDRLAARPPTRA